MKAGLHGGYKPRSYALEFEHNVSRRTLRRNNLWSPLLEHGRIIVPADGWYEWSGEFPEGQAWYLRPKDRQPIFIAALTAWRPGQEPDSEHGFGLITSGFGSGMADPLARTPTILNPEDAESWIDMTIRPADALEDRKSTRLNSSHYCATRMPSSA